MTLHEIRDGLARRAHAMQDAAGRLRQGIGEAQHRHWVEGELDVLFMELGIEVYQRVRADEPIETSVAIADLVDRIASVERERAGPSTGA